MYEPKNHNEKNTTSGFTEYLHVVYTTQLMTIISNFTIASWPC